jgi:hypothetical protein
LQVSAGNTSDCADLLTAKELRAARARNRFNRSNFNLLLFSIVNGVAIASMLADNCSWFHVVF